MAGSVAVGFERDDLLSVSGLALHLIHHLLSDAVVGGVSTSAV